MDDSQESDAFFEVEAITGRKMKKGEVYYLVKWVGYPQSESTWEPLRNLGNVEHLIEDYDRKRANGETRFKRLTSCENQDAPKNKIADSPVKKTNRNLCVLQKTQPNKCKECSCQESSNRKEPKQIKYASISQGELFFMVEWEPTEAGGQPQESLIQHSTFKQNYPYVLLDFYESRMRYYKI